MIKSQIALILSGEDFASPVVIISILIFPVLGSVADCYKAFFINLTASSTSCFSTWGESLIFASDSAILIIDSSYLGVAVTVLVTLP